LADVTDDDVADRNLDNFAAAHCRKPVLVLDLVLQTAELSLLAPVVERRHQHDDTDGGEYGNAFDPPGLSLTLVVRT